MTNTTADALQPLNEDVVTCRLCPRLVDWREEVARTKRRAYLDWDYWGKPVPGFGDANARFLIVGLAPGAHGANRTGRMFTGDKSGDFLFAGLHRAGFANQPTSSGLSDGLALNDCYITAAARCVPPQNRLVAEELHNCRPFLVRELEALPTVRAIMPLGGVAFDAMLRAFRDMGHEIPLHKFAHGVLVDLPDGLPPLLPSYHVSLQNTNTGRLTPGMFDEVLNRVKRLIERR